MSFDPYQPYGPLVETKVRVVTWNTWGRFGDADARQRALEDELQRVDPDIVCLVESWASDDETQPARIAARLGFEHSAFVGGSDPTSGLGIASRWPIVEHELFSLCEKKGGALFVRIDGPRGLVQLFVVALDWPLSASARRQEQVRELCELVTKQTTFEYITLLCGDFNAHPDADEMRALTGRSAAPVADLVFYDAWEIAGDSTAGITWSNRNPLARIGQYPDRRFDYILSAWPRLGAAGYPVHCEVLGVRAEDEEQISDHYGVLADLRY
jgi:endonuclease/exonuclease/phosphatase family metal-dependent hydrolase